MVSTRVVIGAEEDVVAHFYTGGMDELRHGEGDAHAGLDSRRSTGR